MVEVDHPELLSELLQTIRGGMPESVYYERIITSTSSGGTFTRIQIFDLESATYCTIYDKIILTTKGTARGVRVGRERLEDATVRSVESDEALKRAGSSYFPIAWARGLVEHPERITAIKPDGHGGFRVALVRSHSVPDQDSYPVEIEVDEKGMIRSVRFPASPKSRGYQYEYNPAYPAEYMVPTDACVLVPKQWDSMEMVVLPNAPAGAFDFDRLERLAVEHKTNYRDMTVAEVNANRARAGLDPLPMDPMIQDALDAARGTRSRWRMPLIVGGGIAIAIGLLAMWRRKGS